MVETIYLNYSSNLLCLSLPAQESDFQVIIDVLINETWDFVINLDDKFKRNLLEYKEIRTNVASLTLLTFH